MTWFGISLLILYTFVLVSQLIVLVFGTSTRTRAPMAVGFVLNILVVIGILLVGTGTGVL